MKHLMFIAHPVTVIITFLIIAISGESFGGFYVLYLLLALPNFGLHAILALFGILFLLLYNKKKKDRLPKKALGICGIVMLIASLVNFFVSDPSRYNQPSFSSVSFYVTAGLFALSSLAFILNILLS